MPVPDAWAEALAPVAPRVAEVEARVAEARAKGRPIAPAGADVWRALALTPPHAIRAVILGQDPYPTPGHADGLAFSVRPGIAPPRSLRNIFRELSDDLALPEPSTGSLERWARQGVLLLNTALTVEEGRANAHAGWGWGPITDAIVDVASSGPSSAFILWGRQAQARAPRIADRHALIMSAHPSPLSARTGFFGSRPFSRTNMALSVAGRATIDWRL